MFNWNIFMGLLYWYRYKIKSNNQIIKQNNNIIITFNNIIYTSKDLKPHPVGVLWFKLQLVTYLKFHLL